MKASEATEVAGAEKEPTSPPAVCNSDVHVEHVLEKMTPCIFIINSVFVWNFKTPYGNNDIMLMPVVFVDDALVCTFKPLLVIHAGSVINKIF